MSDLQTLSGLLSELVCFPVLQGLPYSPRITSLLKDLYKEIMIRNEKKVGFLGFRYL